MRVFSVLFIPLALAAYNVEITSHWAGGFQGKFCVGITAELTTWKAHMVFDRKINDLQAWRGDVSAKPGGKEFIIQNKPWNGAEHPGDNLCMTFQGTAEGDVIPRATVFIEGMTDNGNATIPPHTDPGTTGASPTGTLPSYVLSGPARYNYTEVLGMSILFYDAQRSGPLPSNNPIPWRGDSALNDTGDEGEDLTGGWYDAGDHVKFNFPMASSSTLLLWGLNRWKDAYEHAGQLDAMYDMIKWPLDYFLKCWRPDKEWYYVQVGDGKADHSYWGRCEDMKMARPALKVTAADGGSDVAGETAASLAAGSIAFKTKDPAYSATLLKAAKSLFAFGKKYPSIYSQSLPEVTYYYASGHFEDEMCVAACWLYKATNDSQYLDDAKHYVTSAWAWALSWDSKLVACQLLLFEITGDSKYSTMVDGYMIGWTPSRGMQYSTCGLAYRDKWGALRYAANTAMVALMAAEDGLQTEKYRKWAIDQINYILGDNKYHMSYVIGYGNKYPVRPHHRTSSCPDIPKPCGWEAFDNPGPNPHLLKGALVGGPDNTDVYVDDRKDYVKNEVACDYNSGFQTALAGLIHLQMSKQLPTADPPKC
ncbi:endoglucanase E-4-like isoform X2 [Haliotis asinina]|uniref:endoglucanase E-4-like isoform X2 n=1 Tax=Haliotis asinina TaxID=109174 RepID=UPI00353209CD